jgi:hypothetical protein
VNVWKTALCPQLYSQPPSRMAFGIGSLRDEVLTANANNQNNTAWAATST